MRLEPATPRSRDNLALYHWATVLRIISVFTQARFFYCSHICDKYTKYVSCLSNWASTQENLSSGFAPIFNSNEYGQLQRLARLLKFCMYQVVFWFVSEALISLVCAFFGRLQQSQIFSRLCPLIVFYDVKDNLPSILALGNDEAFVLNTNTNTMIASYLPLLSIEI